MPNYPNYRIRALEKLTIAITPDDQANAGNYADPHNCLLATAMKRARFHVKKVLLSSAYIDFGGTVYAYYMTEKTNERIYRLYDPESKPLTKPIRITLTKSRYE